MTLDELAAKLDEHGAKIDAQGAKLDAQVAKLDQKFASIDQRFDTMDRKVDEGFKDSKIRDEDLRDLMKFGLEARDVLRDDMHRRFDAADQKHDEQITLLRDAVQHLNSLK
jgi:hypothetical protein